MTDALQVPSPLGSLSTVTTFFTGEIIDGINFGLWTDKWKASHETDLEYWRHMPAFRGVDEVYLVEGKPKQGWVLMRWKG